jgi:hypothetical protein
MVEGRKDDSSKPRWGLLPTDALREITRVLTFGAAKYEARNWEKGIKYERIYSALQRHLTSWWEGEDHDLETGIHHLAHAGCELLFLLAYSLRGMRAWDDRPTTVGCTHDYSSEIRCRHCGESWGESANTSA